MPSLPPRSRERFSGARGLPWTRRILVALAIHWWTRSLLPFCRIATDSPRHSGSLVILAPRRLPLGKVIVLAALSRISADVHLARPEGPTPAARLLLLGGRSNARQ